MKIWKAALVCGALGLGAVAGAHPARAQGTQFPDVPANHWAYQAVQDLADKGYVKGYPDGRFLGKRDLTRYEFATVIDRIVQTVSDLNAKVGGPTTPTGTAVTQDDLNKIQALVDSFQAQLTAIQSQIGPAVPGAPSLTDQLDALRQDVLDAKAIGNKAQATADAAYSSNPKSKFTISGYVQARSIHAENGSYGRYTQGTAAVPGPVNGNYAQGGVQNDLQVRRARLKINGAPTANTKYGLQIDLSGAVNSNTTTPNQQVTTREAYVTYTAGDGTVKYPSVTAGQFATPFGYALPSSMSVFLTPERPLAFSEGNNIGLFDGQDYDKGVQLVYNPQTVRLVYALINGSGRNSENVNNHFDSIYRAALQTADKQAGIGVSYYDGFASRARPTGIPAAQLAFQDPRKQLFGIDGQITLKGGVFVNAEFVKGKYEKRSYFTNASLTGAGGPVLNGDLYATDQYVKNNQVQAYYVQGGYTFGATGNHPLTLAASYDTFLRSHSAQNNSANSLGGNAQNGTNVSSSGGTYDDINLGYGALYNLDKSTRLRVWYDQPYLVAHAAGTAQPPRIGELTTELQVKF